MKAYQQSQLSTISTTRRRAVVLFSGGLDSTLAAKVIINQGLEIIALNFRSPFCRCDRSSRCGSSIRDMANQLGIEFKSVYLGQEYLRIVKTPDYGYGRNLNPCIDCRIFKFRKAKEYMREIGASFVITGEVLGQRPMSQHRRALEVIEREAGLTGLILRPLSAKLFSPTIAEQNNWVNRESLLSISGRTRKPQIKLATELGLKNYPCPAGGCLLTDPAFTRRLKDLMEHEDFNIANVELLKLGRHFRINSSFRLVVGRDEKENAKLKNFLQKDDLYFEPTKLAGPSGLLRGKWDNEFKNIAAKIIAYYTSREQKVEISVSNISGNNEDKIFAEAIQESVARKLMIL